MAIRVDIDEQDLKILRKETGKRFSRQTMILSASCAIILLAAATATFVMWRGWLLLAEARTDAAAPTMAIGALVSAMALIVLTGFAGVLLIKARRKLHSANHLDRVKPGLTTGRFEIYFSDKALIAKGAQGTRKINWAGLDRIAETKSTIVFWRRGEIFAFLPKAGLADNALYEKLIRIYGSRISNKLSCDDNAGANPHKIAFEYTKRDHAEYRGLHHDRLDGWPAVFRRIIQWPAWPPMMFGLSLFTGALAAYSFIVTLSIAAGALASIAALAAIFVFWLNAELFRGPAHPPHKGAQWPFAQSELVSLTLFDGGVCVTRNEGEEIYPWTAFERVVICPLTAYFVLTPQIVLPAPKRAFLDKVHFQAFANYARTHISGAHSHSAAQKKARMARRLSPGAKYSAKKQRPVKALPAPAPAKSLPQKAGPKALPPSPKGAGPDALNAVRSAAKARARLNQAF